MVLLLGGGASELSEAEATFYRSRNVVDSCDKRLNFLLDLFELDAHLGAVGTCGPKFGDVVFDGFDGLLHGGDDALLDVVGGVIFEGIGGRVELRADVLAVVLHGFELELLVVVFLELEDQFEADADHTED